MWFETEPWHWTRSKWHWLASTQCETTSSVAKYFAAMIWKFNIFYKKHAQKCLFRKSLLKMSQFRTEPDKNDSGYGGYRYYNIQIFEILQYFEIFNFFKPFKGGGIECLQACWI